jgi:voltage-gated sodium channel type IV alpha
MVIKLLGLGVKAYVSDGFNVFDGTIVIMTAIDFVLSTLTSQDGLSNMSGVMQSFRSVRLLRIIKLARSWTALQKILESTV